MSYTLTMYKNLRRPLATLWEKSFQVHGFYTYLSTSIYSLFLNGQ